MGGVGGVCALDMCISLCVDCGASALLNFCFSFCKSSIGRWEKWQTALHCLPDWDFVGFCPPRVKNTRSENTHKAAERKILSAESPKCLSTAKFGLLIFKNSCCSFISRNKINQTTITHPQQIEEDMLCNLQVSSESFASIEAFRLK